MVVSNIFLFSPLFGEDFQFDQYFSDGLKPPTRRGVETCGLFVDWLFVWLKVKVGSSCA